MRRYLPAFIATLLLFGCTGGAPRPPHIYVVGVDLSRSFWQTGLTAERRAADLSVSKSQELAFKMRQAVDEINAVLEDVNFIKRVPRTGGSDFEKVIDVATLREKIDDAVVMTTVLQKNRAAGAERLGIVEKILSDIRTVGGTVGKCNFVKTSKVQKTDEEVNPESERRIRKIIDQIETLSASFCYTATVPNQPKVLRETGNDIVSLTTMIDERVTEQAKQGLDPKWRERTVYGKLNVLNFLLNFKIGNKLSTVLEPTARDLNQSVNQIVNDAVNNGPRVFYLQTDYVSYFQRSLREIENMMNDWGEFDRDIGIEITFLIIGDGKQDADGQFEDKGDYDMALISTIKDVFLKDDKPEALLGGIPWMDINKVNIKFCVPQRRYNTDILDQWTKQLQAKAGNGRKISVRYYMFETLKEGGNSFTKTAIDNLLEF